MKNERGFMLLSAIFLTLIVSIMATIFLHSNLKIQQRNSTLYLTAINLANEQFAFIEGGLGDIPAEDRKSFNGMSRNAEMIEFRISIPEKIKLGENLTKATVKVEWTVNGKTETVESTKLF